VAAGVATVSGVAWATWVAMVAIGVASSMAGVAAPATGVAAVIGVPAMAIGVASASGVASAIGVAAAATGVATGASGVASAVAAGLASGGASSGVAVSSTAGASVATTAAVGVGGGASSPQAARTRTATAPRASIGSRGRVERRPVMVEPFRGRRADLPDPPDNVPTESHRVAIVRLCWSPRKRGRQYCDAGAPRLFQCASAGILFRAVARLWRSWRLGECQSG
jgi:hypothetical protein